MDQLPRLGKRELICLLLFTFNYVVSVWRGFLFLWVLGMGYVILFRHSLSLPYNNFESIMPLEYSGEVLSKLNDRGFQAKSLSTYDFSTWYTTLPHNLIKEKRLELIEQIFYTEHKF